MRLPLLAIAGGALVLSLAACQPTAEDSDTNLTSGPAPEAPAAGDAASDAAEASAATETPTESEPAQQTAPTTAASGDMGDARSSEESVEPDSPTMFH
ncbi:hypothetical protein [Brevundimonas aveniformis]|uniref:hypothetical protein n=1 Tax=Brevundimonas aveniformis TaxID=370977 RepID=UPI00248F7718|nr:hypothetical protein [Brevundimonas aveniformis]